jgi:hypothetical protein
MLVFVLYVLSLGFAGANLDDGVGIDPHGGVHAQQFTTDEGNGLDPHGKP